MDFKKRIIEELKLSELQANTLLKDYISTCEKLAKEYYSEQFSLYGVSHRRELLDGLLVHLEVNSYIEGSFLDRSEIIDEYLKTI
jgi:hypothetical protein